MAPALPARHIVLLSDGTGNSSAKLMKTNVWRMYEALDLATNQQIALYDNGVGTSSFKPLAILGGALGFGLKRNVLDLYTFACRNFQGATATQDADRLFAFGFSRGAFTIRVLVGLIGQEGLITGVHGRELERRARWAYRAYRRNFNPTGGLVMPLRWLRDGLLSWWERRSGHQPYSNASNVKPEVAFVGLWDTVDAYGLPIDEMTRGWDRWVWPLSMCARRMPTNVTKVCHAMALDDERHTFHPVLLDESTQPAAATTDAESVTQVWFSGVHSNVGGGYPDDSLAHVSLQWMANEARKQGLSLLPVVTALWDAHVNPHGPLYDSRRGLGSYYRYNPRLVAKLSDDRDNGVLVALPKIHDSVFQRINAARDDYAPIVLPQRFAVVDDTGQISAAAHNPFESPAQADTRAADQERVWNFVWWRRIAYFTTVLLTAALVLPPLFATSGDAAWLKSETLAGLDVQWRAASGAIEVAGSLLPESLQTWVDFYRNHPVPLVFGGILLAALLLISSWLQRTLAERMRTVWDGIRNGPGPAAAPNPPRGFVYAFRTDRRYLGAVRFFSHTVFPFVFGFGVLITLVLAILGTVNRAAFAALGVTGHVCVARDAGRILSGRAERKLYPQNLCQETGLRLERGATYRITVELPRKAGLWKDQTIPVPTADGVGTASALWPYFPALPFRRVLTAQWMQPIARIGDKGAEYHPLGVDVTFTTSREGKLFLFVNDALGPGPFWWGIFYPNNNGDAATVVIEKVIAPRQ